MKVILSAKDLRTILNEKFGEDTEYELSFTDNGHYWRDYYKIKDMKELKRMPSNIFSRFYDDSFKGIIWANIFDVKDKPVR